MEPCERYSERVAVLQQELEDKNKEIQKLRDLIDQKDKQIQQHVSVNNDSQIHNDVEPDDTSDAEPTSIPQTKKQKLDNASISRYSRQLILPEMGVKGQLALANSSVLIIGCGGLGCPAAVYLAAAGLGHLGLVDYDEVELSNLHRQILHSESRVGMGKAESVSVGCKQLNSKIKCSPYHMQLDSRNALELIKGYDVILDCTDNVATRYLLNDACVLTGKPLVSGSALRFEGQLTVYNFNAGPCYRCLYPTPPPPETVTNCSDGGVLGVVPGIIGSLQAMETIKIICQMGNTYNQRLLLYDGLEGTFRTIKLRCKKATCEVCGTRPTITELIDYEEFCGAKASDKTQNVALLTKDDRISVKEYFKIVTEKTPHVLVDVRQPVELEICQLPNTTNIPLPDVGKESTLSMLKTQVESLRKETGVLDLPVYVVCRLGNDSQRAVATLKDQLQDCGIKIKDIRGGLLSWSKQVDSEFPQY